MALRRQRQLLFRIFYSTTFTFFFLLLVAEVLVSPADTIWESYRSHRYLNIFIIAGVYVLTAVLAVLILASRIYTNRSIISSIPKTYIPVEPGDVNKKVRKLVKEGLERNAVIAFNARPRYIHDDIARNLPELSSRLSPASTVSQDIARRRVREWTKISHPGWSSPYSPDIPNLQYGVVIEELPALIEAKAVSLAPADPAFRQHPSAPQTDPYSAYATEEDQATPDKQVVDVLQRKDSMSLREYIAHLASMDLIISSELGEQFLDLYEYARFSGIPLTETEFRYLMSLFAEILRGMSHLDEGLVVGIRGVAPSSNDSEDDSEGYETPTPASNHSSENIDNRSTMSTSSNGSTRTQRRYVVDRTVSNSSSGSTVSLRTAPMSRKPSTYSWSQSATRPSMTSRQVSGASLRPVRSNISTASRSSARSGSSVIRLAGANDGPLDLPYVITMDR